MPHRCQGFSRTPLSEQLVQCEYDAEAGSDLCYLHEKVAAGLITDLSWSPYQARKRKSLLEQLLEKHDDRAQLAKEWA
jgi:hypothetical protein